MLPGRVTLEYQNYLPKKVYKRNIREVASFPFDNVGMSASSLHIASFPGLPRGGERKAWYTLRAHARNFLLKLRNTNVRVQINVISKWLNMINIGLRSFKTRTRLVQLLLT